jgi:pyruvate,water dikinase
MYFPRRADDPAVDHRLLKALLSGPAGEDPEAREGELGRRRDEVAREVMANLARKPLGSLRVEAFKFLLDYAQRFMVIRDDERYWLDRTTYSLKRGFEELGNRMAARGLIDTPSDIHFLGREEAFALFRGHLHGAPAKVKIAGRRHNFERYLAKDVTLPMHLNRGRGIDLEDATGIEDGIVRGQPTSGGRITGTARIVKTVEGIGTVRQGEILVTNATDPGWTPVFMVISGIVLETGGMLAHGSLLAREYGFPAVQVAGATELIPDGALVTVDGDTGLVHIEEESEEQ